ncbi:MAG: lysylphosphatidylglycerol synthase transmembrane domain-containing protein [Ignavibacteriales bacterium]|nr:lysylphosphatidylglycerol synthase transmembrane domain-containing protein [Ignavibacteriales bacterium]
MSKKIRVPKYLYKNFIKIFGILLFIYIITKIDISKVLTEIKNFNLWWLLLYLFCYVFMVLMKSIRWRTLLISQDIYLPLSKVISINIMANFWGIVTPGRIGELSKIAYLQKDELTFSKSIVSVIIDRLYDMAMLILFSFIAMIYFVNHFYIQMIDILFSIALIVVAGIVIFLSRYWIWSLLIAILKRFTSDSKYVIIQNNWREFISEFNKIAATTIPIMTIYSFIIYITYFSMTYIVALGFNISISFIYLSLCLSISALISLLPISIGGFGTREAIFIMFLSKISIPKETALLIPFIDSTVLGFTIASLLALGYKLLNIRSGNKMNMG